MDNRKTFNIVVTMNERWIDTFCSFLARMQEDGLAGHTELLGFMADGDGDFRPTFDFKDMEFKLETDPVEPYKYTNRSPSKIFDAG